MSDLAGPTALGPDGWRFAEAYYDVVLKPKGIPATYRDNARRYWTLASVNYAIDPIVAWCQHAKETNFCRFGGVLDESFHNPAGIKLARGGGDYDPNAHERFPDWDTGIRAHLNHLTAYCWGKEMPPIGVPHGRYSVVLTTPNAGKVKAVADLNTRWAPSPTYGNDLQAKFIDPFLRWSVDLINFINSKGSA